jgi:hypothetical protein
MLLSPCSDRSTDEGCIVLPGSVPLPFRLFRKQSSSSATNLASEIHSHAAAKPEDLALADGAVVLQRLVCSWT